MPRPWDPATVARVLHRVLGARRPRHGDPDAGRLGRRDIQELAEQVEALRGAGPCPLDLTVELGDEPAGAPDAVWTDLDVAPPARQPFDTQLLAFARAVTLWSVLIVLAVLGLVAKTAMTGTEGRDFLTAVAVLLLPLLVPMIRYLFAQRPSGHR